MLRRGADVGAAVPEPGATDDGGADVLVVDSDVVGATLSSFVAVEEVVGWAVVGGGTVAVVGTVSETSDGGREASISSEEQAANPNVARRTRARNRPPGRRRGIPIHRQQTPAIDHVNPISGKSD